MNLPASCDRHAMLSVDEARARLFERARPISGNETEQVPLAAALGRVLAADLRAPLDVPPFANSAMDGYAVRGADVGVAGAVLRVTQQIAAGRVGRALAPGEAARIFTGAPIPEGADTVVMQEDCERDGDRVRVNIAATAGAWVRPRGNSIAQGHVVLAAGAVLRAQDLGMAASVGCATLEVKPRPRVALLSSGDELVSPGEALAPGCIYDTNTTMLRALLVASGMEVRDTVTVPDRLDATRDALSAAARDNDLVLSSGGVSVGDADHMKTALEEIGELDMWRVAVKPGKPLTHGRIGAADYLGVPGNPVSALVTFCLFVRPFLLRRLGVGRAAAPWLEIRAGFDWPTPGRRREYLRARIETRSDGVPEARLFERQGSDVLSSAVWADGLVEIREGTTIAAGERVRWASFNDLLGGFAA